MIYIDSNLLESAKKGDRKAEVELYKKCFSLLMGVALRYNLNADKSAELINDAFIRALDNLDKFQPSHSFQSWIKKIMANIILDDIRKQKRNREISFDIDVMLHIPTHCDYNNYVKNENIKELLSILETLSPATRNVFNLSAIEGYSHKEIAEELGITVETSKWHVKQARKQLRENYEQIIRKVYP